MSIARNMGHKYIFIDLDGTMIDSRPGIFRCVRQTLAACGKTEPSDEQLLPMIGPPLKKGFSLFLEGEKNIDAAVDLYREFYRSGGMFEAEVYSGISESLEALSGTHRLICVTSKAQQYAERIVSHFKLDRYIDKVYGPDLKGKLAEKTFLIRHVLEKENVPASSAVMIGDTHYDVEGARNNDVFSIGVLWGFGKEEDMRKAGANALISDPKDMVPSVYELVEK
ncbi:MAG TPA: HAD hydrolase-like protein [Spirochaetota bacterium]